MAHEQSAIDFIANTTKHGLLVPNQSKRAAVRLALSEAIRGGYFHPGDRLPPERELVEICHVSLGTVQAALSQLVQIGMIERRRGSGTRVKKHGYFSEQIWHFRFLSLQTNQPLQILPTMVRVQEENSEGYWSKFLGNGENYLKLIRSFHVSEGIQIFSHMYFVPQLVPGLVGVTEEELLMLNIRAYLDEEFGVDTSHAEHTIAVVPQKIAQAESVSELSEESWFRIDARARSSKGSPVYFQRIFAPVARCNFTFSTTG